MERDAKVNSFSTNGNLGFFQSRCSPRKLGLEKANMPTKPKTSGSNLPLRFRGPLSNRLLSLLGCALLQTRAAGQNEDIHNGARARWRTRAGRHRIRTVAQCH